MKALLFTFLCFICLPFANAKDFGVVGKTFVIAEADFLEFIQQKIKAMQATGAWSDAQLSFQKQVKAHILRPKPNALPRATRDRDFYFNPSLTVPYDVRDMTGSVIVAKGTVINPLERVGLSSTLLFFNGDDREQVDWVTSELKRHGKVKLILTAGSLKDATDRFRQAVYFDLNGFLLEKFQIKSLPVRVFQEGLRLKISEVAL
ncbi:TPA: type-F conjugative transfer system protein TraW [Legionella pneumophila]|nr:type-F conjugative transfer system protein TraW [Legionella pneumophila]HBD7410333.1 type-F conjugative transfer system protein TraW [Legionella pneumophila]HBD9405526.1 type-F conjugative transfer system protein TraW [Legionella pneumophila]HBI2968755.1 type-F conjugative transfer system protein TraW [Legionella pneumophila]